MPAPEITCPQDLVDKFRIQAKRLRARATVFLWAIVGLVVGGVILVLALPPVIARVDRYLSDVEPPKEAEKLGDFIDKRTARLEDISQQRVDMAKKLNQVFDNPIALWTLVKSPPIEGNLKAIVPMPEGGFIAAGYESGGDGQTTLLMRSNADGDSWSRIRPLREDGIPIRGSINAIAARRDGGFIATVSQPSRYDVYVSLLHGDPSGENWTLVQPFGQAGIPIQGVIGAIVPRSDGGFIAVGGQESGDGLHAMFFLGDPSGKKLIPIRPVGKSGAPIGGWLSAITATQSAGFIAVGAQRNGEDVNALLMQGDLSGRNWTSVRSINSDEAPISGRLDTIALAPDGRFIAAGGVGSIQDRAVLLLHGDSSGNNWSSIHPVEENSARMAGQLDSILPIREGGFIATGYKGSLLDSTIQLVRGDPSSGNWTAVQPAGKDGAPIKGRLNMIASADDGGFIAVGAQKDIRSRTTLLMRSVDSRKIQRFSELILDVDKRDQIARAFDRIIKELDRDDLLMPIEAREQLQLAKDLKQEWIDNFDDRQSLSENRAAIITAWNESQPWQRVSRIVSRVAVIVLLIYLVQIMVNLFRYNTRLAAFYQARADAIDLLVVSKISLGMSLNVSMAELAAALSPDNLDFGRSPTPPTQQVVDMLRDAAKSARAGTA